MGLLTVFANFRIDSEERLLRMKDSFHSFCGADIEKWVINIRGPLKCQATAFLRNQLGDSLILFELESSQGWFHDTRQMLPTIKSDYVFFWLEDHLCISGIDYFNKVVSEMKLFNAEYLLYSAFHHGTTLRSFDCLPFLNGDSIILVNYDIPSHKRRLEYINSNKLICATFIISCCSILKASLFAKIVSNDDLLIRRWPRETPFDFEKNSSDIRWLPIRVAQTKAEFFSFIDDDHGDDNLSLVSRGLYPNRVSREKILEIRKRHIKSSTFPILRKFLRPLVAIESKIRYALALWENRNV